MILSESPRIELIHGDCMDYMKGLDAKAFELAITDPPYGIGEAKKAGNRPKVTVKYRSLDWDNDIMPREYFDKLISVSSNQIVWGANHFIQQIPYPSSCWIVWDKVRGEQDFADCELAWTSFKSSVKQFTFAWDGFRQGDMKNKEHRIHPTQKPVKLYRWLLQNYAKKGDRILDTHLGSGSSAIAAYEEGFDFVGIEKDREYYDGAVKRFRNHIAQTSLF